MRKRHLTSESQSSEQAFGQTISGANFTSGAIPPEQYRRVSYGFPFPPHAGAFLPPTREDLLVLLENFLLAWVNMPVPIWGKTSPDL
jgi:hypothetical protein